MAEAKLSRSACSSRWAVAAPSGPSRLRLASSAAVASGLIRAWGLLESGDNLRRNRRGDGLWDGAIDRGHEAVCHHRTQHRKPQRAADGPIELCRRGRRAHDVVRDGVLHRDGVDRERHAQAKAHDHYVQRRPSVAGLVAHQRYQEHAGAHDAQRDEALEAVVASEARERLSRGGRPNDDSEHHRGEEATAAGGRRSEHALKEQRDEQSPAEHSEPGKKNHQQRYAHHSVAVDRQGHNGIGDPQLDEDEHDGSGRRDRQGRDHLRRGPPVLHAAPGQAYKQRDHRQHQERHAGEVDMSLRPGRPDVGEPADEDRDDWHPQRQIDVEDPVPRQRVGDEPAESRPDYREQTEDGRYDPLVLPTLARGKKVGNGNERNGHHDAATEALDRPKGDELVHRLALSRQHRAGQEDSDSRDVEALSPMDVRQLADDGDRCGGGHQVCGHDPREAVQPAQVGNDTRHRRADDGLVERRQEDGEHDSSHRQDDLPSRQCRRKATVRRLAVVGPDRLAASFSHSDSSIAARVDPVGLKLRYASGPELRSPRRHASRKSTARQTALPAGCRTVSRATRSRSSRGP